MDMKNLMKIFFSFLILGGILAILDFAGCVDLPNDVIMPQWDVDLNVPLLKKSYVLEDIVKSDKDPNISIDPIDSLYVIHSDDYLSSTGVSEFMQMTNESSSNDNILPVVENDSLQIYIPFPDSLKIDNAKFKTGAIAFNFVNHSALGDMNINIKIPGIIKPDGTSLSLDFIVHANRTYTSVYLLQGHSYQEPANQISLFKGQIWLIAKATSLDNLAYSSFNVTAKEMEFSYAEGYIPTKVVHVNQDEYAVDLGSDIEKYKDKVSLKDAILFVNASYKTNTSDPYDLEIKNLNIVGKRNSGAQEQLQFYENTNSPLSPVYRFNNGQLQKTFDETNSNITDFISFMPDSIIVSADYVINPDDDKTYRTVNELDSVVFETNFTAKSSLILRQTTVTDTLDVDISSDNRDQINKAQSASMTIEADNHIPMTAFFKITLADSNYNPLFTLKGNDGVDSLQFTGAAVDQQTGEVTETSGTSQSINLNTDEIKQLANAKYAFISASIRTKDALDSNQNPPYVTVRPSDWINLKSFGNIKYRVNGDNNN